jgi:2-hydroxy-3-keto-5-methylthiopentenyl-1-phosphate phosphatase
MNSPRPTLIQCDFDGTLTVGDVSFQILDAYTGNGWRQLFDDYMAGKMSVNCFNTTVFAKVNADRKTLDAFVRKHAVMRPGFKELLDVSRKKGYRFVIVSNGMMFYIENILDMLGLKEVEFMAARANFKPGTVEAWYEGPDGKPIEDGFKEAYTRHFIGKGYDVVYIGNGASDFAPARLCKRIFSIDNLTKACQEAGVAHTPFNTLDEIADKLETLI